MKNRRREIKKKFSRQIINTSHFQVANAIGIRRLPRLDISPTDTSQTDTSQTGQLPDWHFPNLTFLPTRHLSEWLFPRLDISPTGHFPD